MKRNVSKKLVLSRQTLRALDAGEAQQVRGGLAYSIKCGNSSDPTIVTIPSMYYYTCPPTERAGCPSWAC